MAKTKRTKKSKQDQISEKLRTRIISAVVLFLVIISVMKFGVIGEQFNYISTFCFGDFVGIIYAFAIIGCGYVIYYAKLPKFDGPRAVGIYMICGAILVYIAAPSDKTMVGMKLVNQYTSTMIATQGGLVGAVLYGIFSSLFAYNGTMIAAIFSFAIGVSLIGSKFYFEHKKKTAGKPKPSVTKNKIDVFHQGASKFTDFFTHRKEKVFFPEETFEDKKIKDKKEVVEDKEEWSKFNARVHQIQSDEEEPVSTLEYNEEEMALEIKNNKPMVKEEPSSNVIVGSKNVKVNKNYRLPSLTSLKSLPNQKNNDNRNHALENADRLTSVLKEFGVNASVSDIFIGPTVTKYELKLETGTRVNRILQLQDDIKLALATKDIRIEAPIPGKAAVGVEIPNRVSSAVSFKEVFKDIPKDLQDNKLLVPLGKDVSGKCIYAELNKMPHLLIAGATGSGKSVCINTIICSILMRARPDEVKLILVDPKKVELSNYNGIPHLLAPVVTDPKKAALVLREVVSDMESRYDMFANANVRNIEGYNAYVNNKNSTLDDSDKLESLAYHVVILDEVADLMMVASKDVEDCIMRIAQMARAAGIHLIVATQRPSTDVITGVIKANIPSRIGFAVSSSIDSRTILDSTGAEKLLGKGDMLFSPMGSSSPIRVQGAFVSDEEVETITYHVSKQQETVYEDKFVNVKSTATTSSKEDEEDEEYEMCRTFVINAQKASTSLLQRQFRIGYNKAARIIDQLEADGIIGPQIGSKPREVFVRGYEEEL